MRIFKGGKGQTTGSRREIICGRVMSGYRNISYIFIPFIFEKRSDFDILADALHDSRIWSQVHDEIVYMLKYVANKLNSRDLKTASVFIMN